MSKVFGWLLVLLGVYVIATLSSDGPTAGTGGAAVLALVLFVAPGVWLIRRQARRDAKRQEQIDDMAEAIETAIKADRESR